MKINNNIKEVAKLRPDFMGFIFWPKTKRFFSEKEISKYCLIKGEIIPVVYKPN